MTPTRRNAPVHIDVKDGQRPRLITPLLVDIRTLTRDPHLTEANETIPNPLYRSSKTGINTDYWNRPCSLTDTLFDFKDAPDQEKEEIKRKFLKRMAEFETYQGYCIRQIQSYNEIQERWCMEGKIPFPKKIDVEDALQFIFENERARRLDEVATQIKVLGQQATDIDVELLRKLRDLICEAHLLINGDEQQAEKWRQHPAFN